MGIELPDAIDHVPVGDECECGPVYSPEHHFCSRRGAPLKPSIVPKATPGRLQFDRRVGKGGAGIVYETLDLALGRRLAVKTLPTVCSQLDVARLRKEAQALAAISHRNLATVYGFEVYRGTPMILMEYVDGGTLAGRIPLPLDVAKEVMLEVTEVVGCLRAAPPGRPRDRRRGGYFARWRIFWRSILRSSTRKSRTVFFSPSFS